MIGETRCSLEKGLKLAVAPRFLAALRILLHEAERNGSFATTTGKTTWTRKVRRTDGGTTGTAMVAPPWQEEAGSTAAHFAALESVRPCGLIQSTESARQCLAVHFQQKIWKGW